MFFFSVFPGVQKVALEKQKGILYWFKCNASSFFKSISNSKEKKNKTKHNNFAILLYILFSLYIWPLHPSLTSQYPDLLLPKAMPPAKLPASPHSAIHPHANTLQPPSTTAPALTRLPLEHHGKPLQSKQHFLAQHYMRPHSLCKSGSNAALGAASRKELLWARTTTCHSAHIPLRQSLVSWC